MSKHQVEDIHTVALVGHEVAGKTSLADAILFKAKATDRRGNVEDGTSFSDFDDEEKKHKYSIDCSVLHFDHLDKRVYLIDTPGKPDFVGQALCGLNAVDTAVLVISATAGIQVNTRRMFNESGKRGLARMIVINKMDSDNIHLDELLANIRNTFGKACVLFNAPIDVGPKFSGVVSVLTPPASAPASCPVDLAAHRSLLVDCIVEVDEALMEKYLAEGDLSVDELGAALPKALAAGTVIPIFFTAAKKDKDLGVAELLEAIDKYSPSPVTGIHRKAIKGTGEHATEIVLDPSEGAEFVAQVFKTISDKFVGNLSYFRVLAGKITAENYGKDLGLDGAEQKLEVDSENLLIWTDDTKANGIFTITDDLAAKNIDTLAKAGLTITKEQLFDMSVINEIYVENPEWKVPPA